MNAKHYKLVPVSPEEIAADPTQPFVTVWNTGPDGRLVIDPPGQTPQILPDWRRHIGEGSAAVFNTDNLIKEAK